MDSKSWTDKKRRLEEKYGGEQYGNGYRHIITGIKGGLANGRLPSIKAAAHNLHTEPGKAPAVVAHLNNSIGCGSLSFRWFPGKNNQSGKLLIRNQSIGLILKAEPGCSAEGVQMNAGIKSPISPLAPELALSVLSRHTSGHMHRHSCNNMLRSKEFYRSRQDNLKLHLIPGIMP